MQMKDMFRSQREEAEREFELARAEEEEMSDMNFKSTFFWDTLYFSLHLINKTALHLTKTPAAIGGNPIQ